MILPCLFYFFKKVLKNIVVNFDQIVHCSLLVYWAYHIHIVGKLFFLYPFNVIASYLFGKRFATAQLQTHWKAGAFVSKVKL